MRQIPERDWKYLKKINPDMLDTLCLHIHKKAKKIIDASDNTEHKKYIELFEHIQKSDEIIGRCFDDWKRSNIFLKISQLLAHNLLTDEHIQNLSDETKKRIEIFRNALKK